MKSRKTEEATKFKEMLVNMANSLATSDPSNRTMAAVRKLIDAHDLVMAVWQDTKEPNGVGMTVIKGERALRTVAATGKREGLKTTGPFPAGLSMRLLR